MKIPCGELYQEMADVYFGRKEDLCWNPKIEKQKQKWKLLEEIKKDENTEWLKNYKKKRKNVWIFFCYSHCLNEWIEKVMPQIKENYKLITHNSDEKITKIHETQILQHENCIEWYGQNFTMKEKHPTKMKTLPIGFANEQWEHGNKKIIEETLAEITIQKTTKQDKVYYNFNTETNKLLRKECEKAMEKENIPRLENVDYKSHLLRLHEYKWCVCPEGNGPDTHRLWECIYMKTIPIVVRSEFIENLKMDYEDIPWIVLENWEEFSMEKIMHQTNELEEQIQSSNSYSFENTIEKIQKRMEEIVPQRIPRKIYQTWKTKSLSSGLLEIQERIKEKNPTYEMILFDDAMMDNYIKHTQTPKIQECYHQLASGTAKADLWRYIVLYEEGGVYLDMDAEIIECLDEMIQEDDRAILSREGNKGYFLQWMMVFEKGHPFLKRTLELCVENIKQKKMGTIFEITGPKMYTQAINECTGNENLYEIKDEEIQDEKYRIYGIDYPGYGKFKHEKCDELYRDQVHWTCSHLPSIYKEIEPPICTFENLGSHGRLGNVLFQYAALLGYATKKGYMANIPKNIDEKIHHSQACMLKEFKITVEESEEIAWITYMEQCDGGHYDEKLWEHCSPVNLQGHFESEKYFHHIRNKIKKELETKLENNYKIEKIGIHFRRGDDVTINQHEYTTQEYNKRFIAKCLEYLKKQGVQLENTEIIIFTGGTREKEGTPEYEQDQMSDREWCMKFMGNYFPNLKIKMSQNEQTTQNSVMEDFMKMQKCENLIINSASSMAWWAGYLNKIKGKRILVGPVQTKSENYWPNDFIQIM